MASVGVGVDGCGRKLPWRNTYVAEHQNRNGIIADGGSPYVIWSMAILVIFS